MNSLQRIVKPSITFTLALSLSIPVILPLSKYIMNTSPTPARAAPSPANPPTSTSTTFILDFDGTITAKDTISPLFNAALDFHVQRGKGQEMGDALKEILKGYMSDFDAYEKLKGKQGGCTTVREVVAYQRGLRGVESRSFERVSRSGILGGLDEEVWARVARRAVDDGGGNKDGVIVREGIQSFIRKLRESQGTWKVLSVNFSESWIRGILSTQGVDDVEIRANQPDDLGRLQGPKGEDGRRGDVVVTSNGKLATMQQILKGATEGTTKVVYIGDSLTDIECLLEIGVIGIVMVGEDGMSKLLDVLRLVSSDEGYEYLKDIRDIKDFNDKEGKGLYFAKDFRDIRDSPLLD